MSASRRYRESIACDLQAREQDRRKEAWICFLFALVVAPAAYVQGTPHWPFAAAGLAFASVWLVATLAKRGRPGRLPRAGRVPSP